MQNVWSKLIAVRNAKVPMLPPPLIPNRPYSKEHGSVYQEIIARLLHENPIFDDDTATCFNHLEEATRGTIIDATIQPFKRHRNGQGAWRAIIAEH